MYFIGIDISKYKHDCCIIDDSQAVIACFSFTNDMHGFAELEAYLKSVPNPYDEMKIGFEATSHYALNLKLFLEESHHTFMEFNPILLSKFKSANTLRRTKTDSVDCFVIAHFMMTVDFKPYPRGFYHMYSLKSLTRCRYKLIKSRLQQPLFSSLKIIHLLKRSPGYQQHHMKKLGKQLTADSVLINLLS